MIVDVDYRNKHGKAGKEFIDKNWRAEIVAENFMLLIEGKFPDEWIYHPSSLSYMYGCGLSKENAKSQVKSYKTFPFILLWNCCRLKCKSCVSVIKKYRRERRKSVNTGQSCCNKNC